MHTQIKANNIDGLFPASLLLILRYCCNWLLVNLILCIVAASLTIKTVQSTCCVLFFFDRYSPARRSSSYCWHLSLVRVHSLHFTFYLRFESASAHAFPNRINLHIYVKIGALVCKCWRTLRVWIRHICDRKFRQPTSASIIVESNANNDVWMGADI